MTLSIHGQPISSPSSTTHPTVKREVENMMGVLWYEMLSDLSQTGMDPNALGTGGSNFQSMFLWNVSENDFSHYDSKLVNAAVHQVGGASDQAPESVPTQGEGFGLSTNATVTDMPIQQEALAPLTASSFSSPDMVVQATDFVKSIWPQITAAAKALGVPTIAVLAQAALETGWGMAAPGHNLFGIKAVDGQAGSMRATHEMIDGILTPQIGNFRDYDNSSSSISDYVSLIRTLYPNAVGQGSVAGYAQALQAGGYATDQSYAGKIEQIAQSPLMVQVLQAVGDAQPSNQGAGP